MANTPAQMLLLGLLAGEPISYEEAIVALQSVCRNQNMVLTLSKRDNATNRAKVVYELMKALPGDVLTKEQRQALQALPPTWNDVTAPVNPAPTQEGTAAGEVPQEEEDLEYQPTPEEEEQIKMLQAEHETFFQARAAASNRLADVTTDAERTGLTAEILRMDEEMKQIGTRIRLVATGKAAELDQQPVDEQPATPVDRAALMQSVQNLRSRISKTRRSAETAKTADKRLEATQKLAKLQLELQQLEDQLKAQA